MASAVSILKTTAMIGYTYDKSKHLKPECEWVTATLNNENLATQNKIAQCPAPEPNILLFARALDRFWRLTPQHHHKNIVVNIGMLSTLGWGRDWSMTISVHANYHFCGRGHTFRSATYNVRSIMDDATLEQLLCNLDHTSWNLVLLCPTWAAQN